MKLFRYNTANGKFRTGVSLNDDHFDVGDHIKEYDRDFFDEDGLAKLQTIVEQSPLQKITEPIHFAAPVYRPEKIICIGLNYRKHAEESGMEPPKEPVVFFKSPGKCPTIPMNLIP